MSISSEINRISINVTNSFSAVSDKGGTFSVDANSDDLADAIRTIPEGGDVTSVNGKTGDVVLDTTDIGAASNPNLSDNPVFSVNQRGLNSYTSSGTITPSFDRWLIQRGTITKSQNGGATFQWSGAGSDGYLLQRYEDELGIKLAGKTITISVIVDGEIVQVSGVAPSKGGADIDIITESVRLRYRWLVDSQTSVNRPEIMVNFLDTNIYNITGIKLELGSMSTIVNDSPSDYATELLKCQRYLYVLKGADSAVRPLFFGIVASDGVRGYLDLHTEMRTTPAISITLVTKNIWTNGASYGVSDIAVSGMNGNRLWLLATSSSSLTTSQIASVNGNNNQTGNILLTFSAEL